MRPVSHAFSSFGAAALAYAWFNSINAAAVCFLSGLFFDLDHVPEYLSLKGKLTNLREFYCSNLAEEKKKIFLWFHSFEFIFLFWVIVYKFRLNMFWVSLGLGASVHLILDLIANPIVSPFSYFLIYRFKKRFSSQSLFHLDNRKGRKIKSLWKIWH